MPALFAVVTERFPWLKPKGFVSAAQSNPDQNLDSNKTGPLVVALDCMVLENFSLTAEATKSEVEDGSIISDHVTLKPPRLLIEGVITNTPLLESLAFLTTNVKLLPNPASAAFKILEQMYRDRKPFDFVGGLKVYKNMVFTSFNPVRNARTGQTLQFQATLDQIRTVATQTVKISKINSADRPTAAPTNPVGTQVTSPARAKGVEPTAKTVGDTTILDLAPKNIPVSFVNLP
jgi:hypothetical protein